MRCLGDNDPRPRMQWLRHSRTFLCAGSSFRKAKESEEGRGDVGTTEGDKVYVGLSSFAKILSLRRLSIGAVMCLCDRRNRLVKGVRSAGSSTAFALPRGNVCILMVRYLSCPIRIEEIVC